MSTKSPAPGPLSITHVTTFYPPHNFGGDGVHVQRLARAQARRGHRVSVVCAPGAHALLGGRGAAAVGAEAATDDEGVNVMPLGGWRSRLEAFLVQQTGQPILFRRRLRRLLETVGGGGPDVVHFHNVSLVGGAGVLNLGRRSLRLYTPHEYWALCPTHLLFRYDREVCTRRTCVRCTLHSRRPPQWWRYVTPPARALRQVDGIVFPSELTESVYRRHGVDGPGVVWRHFLPDGYVRAAEARGRRVPDVERYFLYAGRLDAVKGVESLLRAIIAAGNAAVPLWLAGQGPLEAALRARFGAHPSVRFLGHQDHDSLGRLYRDAVAVILPSAGYEVFGQVVVEGYAHGTPAIVSSVGGAGELVRGSGAGFVYAVEADLLGAMQRLATDADLREAMGQRGRSYVQRELGEGAYMARYEAFVRQARRP